jgi:translation initiation factor 2 alpha subunit (eIF-2alpha)
VFDVATNFAQTALESLEYVADRLYAKFDAVYATFEEVLTTGQMALESFV